MLQVLQFNSSRLSGIIPAMERKRVNASTIRSAGYDAAKRVLEIEFTSGSIVQYSGVSQEIYWQFVAAPSPGSFFQDKIDENYPQQRVR